MGYPMAVGRNSKAIPALICGLLSLVCFGVILGVVAIVLGTQARSEISRTGQSGEGQALAGIILGVVGLVGWAIFLVAR